MEENPNGEAGGAGSDSVIFQVGMDPSQTVTVSFGDFTDAAGKTMNSSSTFSWTPPPLLQRSIRPVKFSLRQTGDRGSIDAKGGLCCDNRLVHAVYNLTNVMINAESTRAGYLIQITQNRPQNSQELR